MSLRHFLKKNPQPARLRVRTADDEERIIELSPQLHNRWKAAEEAVLAARATVVECLDAAGATLRAMQLEHDDEEDDDDDRRRKSVDQVLSKERKELAGILDRYGERLNEAFERGAAAAGVSQDNLVGLVEGLTGHLSAALTSVHNLSVNIANLIQSSAIDAPAEGNQELLTKVLSLAAAKAMGGGAAAAAPNNGKGKP